MPDGAQRKQLIDRFRDEVRGRAFLSTDAGGVGPNLQHASVVVNMDLSWNPAVLVQSIGRLHRPGLKRPVQVINFVAEGTIEEGMLSVLRFKKSLFAGVLDGGEREVFLGGSRLTRFMETVEKTFGGHDRASFFGGQDTGKGTRLPQSRRLFARRSKKRDHFESQQWESDQEAFKVVATSAW